MGLVERRLVGEDEDENELSQQEEGAPGDGSVVWESQVRGMGSMRRKQRTPTMMERGEVDLKRSWRVRNEQASAEKVVANFRKKKQGGGRVRGHTWLFLWIPDPEQGCPVLAWNILPRYPWCVSLNSPKLYL